jgi:D-alanine-D-alanine ligase
MKKHLDVLYLFDVPEPAASMEYSDHFRPEDWQRHQEVIATLEKLGHRVRLLGLYDTVVPLIKALRKAPPDIVFHQLEALSQKRCHEASIASLLELFGIPYTGNPPLALQICQNKLFTKRLLAPYRIQVPKSICFPLHGGKRSLEKLRFPIIVKPLALEGSDGIAQSSYVETVEACLDRVAFLRNHYCTDVLAEEYIHGRELYAGVIGNHRIRVLPLRELHFTKFPSDRPKFATEKVKWDENFQERWGILHDFAGPLDPDILQKIERIAKTAFQVLYLYGYARVDLRLTPDNEVYVIEVNPNPALDPGDELAQAAARGGLPFPELIMKILQLGLASKAKTPYSGFKI